MISVFVSPAAQPQRDGLGGQTTQQVSDARSYQMPVANLHESRRELFALSNELFNLIWRPGNDQIDGFDGLGPLFMNNSCIGCHPGNGRGHLPLAQGDKVFRFIARIGHRKGELSTHPEYGNHIDLHSVEPLKPEAKLQVKYEETKHTFHDGEAYTLRRPVIRLSDLSSGSIGAEWAVSVRISPPVFGLGLLEAIEDAAIIKNADPEDKDGDGITGFPNSVRDVRAGKQTVGRFGWKASQPNLLQQTAAALSGDMGLTTTLFPDEGGITRNAKMKPEVTDQVLSELTAYTRLLAVPAQRGADREEVVRGAKVFSEVGCAKCHVPSFRTGKVELLELSEQIIWPYTDLLLHDMGAGLSDDLTEGNATGRHWRTAPLWGIGLTKPVSGYTTYLHDGRARTLVEAIMWHGGEASKVRDDFGKLPKVDRAAVLAFLASL